MTLRTSAALSSLSLAFTSACLQLPTIRGESAGGGQTSGRTTATGGGSAGSTAGGTTGQACIVGETPHEIGSCGDAGACGCPLQCVTDPLATPIDSQGRVCEAQCQADADCEILTACVAGSCALIACGADAGNGTYAFACGMGDQSTDGSCFVQPFDGGRFSFCVAGGTSDGGCDTSTASRSVPSSLCVPGYLCFANPGSPGRCAQLCDEVTTTCPPGQKCNLQLQSPNWGYCQ